jgi:hypothetical protein
MYRSIWTAVICLGSFAACSEYEISGGQTTEFVADDIVEAESLDLSEDLEEPGASNAPVAVCDVAPLLVTPPFESAEWSGDGSFDPDGGQIIEYRWTLAVAPSGSALSALTAQSMTFDFQPDLAGTYIGQLIVVNDAGMESEPCEALLEAVPAQELWVEMYWEKPNDDMDLHLIRKNGSVHSGDDCHYQNCTGAYLDWGNPSAAGDDPQLDLDDIYNTGPENINIDSPESIRYTVAVHDHPGLTYKKNNQVTVNVYLSGSMVWTDTRGITGEDEVEYFAEIDWTAGTVSSL